MLHGIREETKNCLGYVPGSNLLRIMDEAKELVNAEDDSIEEGGTKGGVLEI